MNDLYTFLLRVGERVERNVQYSHVARVDGEVSYWQVPFDNYVEFWNDYCDMAEWSMSTARPTLSLAEHIADNSVCVTAAFDFSFTAVSDPEWDPLTDPFLEKLVKIYQRTIQDLYLILSKTRVELICVVSQSEPVRNGDTTVLRLEFRFPYCRVMAPSLHALRNSILKVVRETKVLNMLPILPTNGWQTILTPPPNGELVMFGSVSDLQTPLLRYKKIYGAYIGELLQTIEISDASNFTDYYRRIGIEPSPLLMSLPSEHWLPILMSNTYAIDLSETRPVVAPVIEVPKETCADDPKRNMALAEYFVNLLGKERYHNELQWLDIGKALYRVSSGAPAGLGLWISATATALGSHRPPFIRQPIEYSCSELYNTFDSANITIRTLGWYARQDNNIAYSAWHIQWCTKAMENATSCLDTDIGKCIYKTYWLEYICSDYAQDQWFEYVNHRWRESTKGVIILQKMSNDLVSRFDIKRSMVVEQIRTATDEGDRMKLEVTMEKLGTVIKSLKTTHKKAAIKKAAAEEFIDTDFLSHINKNKDITGTSTGVLEIVGDKIVMREGKPEDYITVTTGVPYSNDFTMQSPLVIELMEWLKRVFMDPEVFSYFMKFAASFFRAGNNDKLLVLLSGEGYNSKSMIVKLVAATWGSHLCVKMPVAIFTDKNVSAAGPSPHLARTRDTRIVFADEPDDNQAINKATVKRLTGGDSYYTRKLHENGSDVTMSFKLAIQCNRPAEIPNADAPTVERVSLIPFLSRWTINPPHSIEDQIRTRTFKADPYFDRRIPLLAPAFLWLSAQYFNLYSHEGMDSPAIVKEWTARYWRDNDTYAQFTEETIDKVVIDPTEPLSRVPFIRLSQVYDEFKTWFKSSFPGARVPGKMEVKTELSTPARWGPLTGGCWRGIQIKPKTGHTDDDGTFGVTIANVHSLHN
jgi:phage/plasmid-associated DNA primase